MRILPEPKNQPVPENPVDHRVLVRGEQFNRVEPVTELEPEIGFIDDVKKIHGMDLSFVTSTQKDDEAFALLRELGFPFRGQVPVQIGASA